MGKDVLGKNRVALQSRAAVLVSSMGNAVLDRPMRWAEAGSNPGRPQATGLIIRLGLARDLGMAVHSNRVARCGQPTGASLAGAQRAAPGRLGRCARVGASCCETALWGYLPS